MASVGSDGHHDRRRRAHRHGAAVHLAGGHADLAAGREVRRSRRLRVLWGATWCRSAWSTTRTARPAVASSRGTPTRRRRRRGDGRAGARVPASRWSRRASGVGHASTLLVDTGRDRSTDRRRLLVPGRVGWRGRRRRTRSFRAWASPRRPVSDAPVVAGPRPLVVFSHGRSGLRTSYVMLCEGLAARGFVVVALDHPGDTLLDWMTGTAVDDATNERATRRRRAVRDRRAAR